MLAIAFVARWWLAFVLSFRARRIIVKAGASVSCRGQKLVSGCSKIPELRYSTSFAAVKSRNSKLLMYFNPGRKNVLRNGEDRERLRSC